jgi:hypothetical protein
VRDIVHFLFPVNLLNIKFNTFLILKSYIAKLKVRDAEGAEGGTEWSASEMEYGSEADPGASPTAWVGMWEGKPARPKKVKS